MCVNVALAVDLSRDAVAHLNILTHTLTDSQEGAGTLAHILTMLIHTCSHCSAAYSEDF